MNNPADNPLNTHADLTPLAGDYYQQLRQFDDDGSQFDLMRLPSLLRTWVLRQRVPLMIDENFHQRMSREAELAGRLLCEVPLRVARQNPEFACRFWGMSNPQVAHDVLVEHGGYEQEFFRIDLIYSEQGFKALELNSGPKSSGFYAMEWLPLYADFPPTAQFLQERNLKLECVDTRLDVFRHAEKLIKQMPNAEGQKPCLFIAICKAQAAELLDYINGAILADIAPEQRPDLTILAGEPGDFEYTEQGLRFEGQPVHAILLSEFGISEKLYKLYKQRQVVLFDTPTAYFSMDKRNFALATSLRQEGWFSAEECAVLDRLVPWSALLVEGEVNYQGKQWQVRELALANQERWVLKHSRNHSGKGVVVGRFVSAGEWEEVVNQSFGDDNWVLQEFFPSRPFLMLDKDQGVCEHDIVWGMFVIGDKASGGTIRSKLRDDTDGVINVSRSAHEGLYCIHSEV